MTTARAPATRHTTPPRDLTTPIPDLHRKVEHPGSRPFAPAQMPAHAQDIRPTVEHPVARTGHSTTTLRPWPTSHRRTNSNPPVTERNRTSMTTHEVFNQAPPRVGVNEFESNAALTEGAKRYDISWAIDHLSEVGELVGRADFRATPISPTHTHRCSPATTDGATASTPSTFTRPTTASSPRPSTMEHTPVAGRTPAPARTSHARRRTCSSHK